MKLSEYINKLKVVRYEPFKPLFGKVCMAQDKDGELTYHGNVFIIIAESCTHPMSGNGMWVKELFRNF